MPVKFRGASEYSSKYKWQSSFRSPSYQPPKEQLQLDAGLRSDEFNLLIEPGFTKKKQVPHRRPEAGDCLVWWHGAVEEVESEKSFKKEKKPLVISAKGDGDHIVVKTNNDKVVSVCKNVKAEPKEALNESKCSWEKDKQSQYVQKLRKELDSKEETKTSPERKSRHLKRSPPKSSPSLPQKSNTSISKPKKSTPTKSQKYSPVKSKTVSPEKKAKPSNRPLRYRPLQQRMLSTHQSEYQTMYKKPARFIPSSPLISALDVVHSSSPAIPPHKSPKMLCKTEYATKFQTQSPLSKSMQRFSPPSPSRLRVRDLPKSVNLSRSPRKLESEYADQYPIREYPSEVNKQLFEEAQHNKLNREGSVFDKDHVNQICSPTNKCWDLASLSMKSEATEVSSVASKSQSLKSNGSTEENRGKLSTVNEENEEDVESIVVSDKDSLDTRSAVTSSTLNQSIPVARKLAWGDDDENDDDNDDISTAHGSTVTKSSSNNGFEGRIPTPQLRRFGGALRSHHDITTPSPGGALLTSPSSSEKKKRFARSFSPKLDADVVDEKPVKLSKTMPTPTKASSQESPNFSKTANVISSQPSPDNKDSHQKEVADVSKIKRKADLPRFIKPTTRAPIQGALRSQEFQHCGVHSRPSTGFDRISRASSASIASADDLLQRSLQRCDFWKTK